MTSIEADPELLRQVAAALRWAAWTGARRMPRPENYTPPEPPLRTLAEEKRPHQKRQDSSSPPSERSKLGSRPKLSVRPRPGARPKLGDRPKLNDRPKLANRPKLSDRPKLGEEPKPRTIPKSKDPSPKATKPATPATRASSPAEALKALRTEIEGCQRCPRHRSRTQIVHGSGPARARLLIVNAEPGVAEDLAGELWQGPAGALLDKMLVAMGLFRSEVHLASLVQCRASEPPTENGPDNNAIDACTPFLRARILAVAPEVVLVLGTPAARFLFRQEQEMGKLRGVWRRVLGFDAIVSHDPATLLQNPALKREAWNDLKEIMKRLNLKR